jgi:hypothetical protein
MQERRRGTQRTTETGDEIVNNIAGTLRECHRIVWQYRAELKDVWPTPTTEDALLFALTELGEAVDAHLRSKPQYVRNRDKDLSVLDELADCAMMVLTAIGPDLFYNSWSRTYHARSWRSLNAALNFIIKESEWEDDVVLTQADRNVAATLVRDIATYPGMDLPSRLTARLERIKAKQLPAIDDAYANALMRHAGECQ